MFIRNDTIYTVTAGNCLGGGMTPSDMESLAQRDGGAAFPTGLSDAKLVDQEEMGGLKANHYQVTGPTGLIDIWTSQAGGYVLRLVGPGPPMRKRCRVTTKLSKKQKLL